MILSIIKYGQPVLRMPGKPITEFTENIRNLAENMIETMHAANGIGLAAQQVGETLLICVLDVPELEERPARLWIEGEQKSLEKYMPMVLINPELKLSKQKETGEEGCLSFPDIRGEIIRSVRTKVKALDLNGKEIQFECDGLLARAVQHEFDHLKGILFIDRMDSASRLGLKKKLEALKDQSRIV